MVMNKCKKIYVECVQNIDNDYILSDKDKEYILKEIKESGYFSRKFEKNKNKTIY